jgi:hypothetical protein
MTIIGYVVYCFGVALDPHTQLAPPMWYDAPGIQNGYGSWAPNTITNPVYDYTPL